MVGLVQGSHSEESRHTRPERSRRIGTQNDGLAELVILSDLS